MEKVRIDKYLWAIRVFKTRSLATKACDGGKVKMNGAPVKPSRPVGIGEQYEIKTSARNWRIQVTDLTTNRRSFSEAIKFYVDLTPEEEKKPPKQSASFYTGKRQSKTGKPTKKERRSFAQFMDENDFFEN